jgi:hypothetical protein
MEEVVFGLDYRMSVGRPEKAKKMGCVVQSSAVYDATHLRTQSANIWKKSPAKKGQITLYSLQAKNFQYFQTHSLWFDTKCSWSLHETFSSLFWGVFCYSYSSVIRLFCIWKRNIAEIFTIPSNSIVSDKMHIKKLLQDKDLRIYSGESLSGKNFF